MVRADVQIIIPILYFIFHVILSFVNYFKLKACNYCLQFTIYLYFKGYVSLCQLVFAQYKYLI